MLSDRFTFTNKQNALVTLVECKERSSLNCYKGKNSSP